MKNSEIAVIKDEKGEVNFMGRKRVLPKGVRRKGGTYEARATINKIPIYAYGKDLDLLLKEFEYKKEQARNRVDYRKNGITLNGLMSGSKKSKRIK